jgi:tRNA(adenine34) deaminase
MSFDTKTSQDDEKWMRRALELARKAADRKEVPVGAVLVREDKILAEGFNLRESLHTPLGHAELIALQRGSKKLEAWRLINTTLYVTLEPCIMCAGAMVQARISRLVYGATDPKAGAVESLYRICGDSRLNHQIKITSGVLAQECSFILKEFFRKKRLEQTGKNDPYGF